MTELAARKSLQLFTTKHNMFSLIFSADLGKQRSALTTPLLTGVLEAVFRSKRPPKKGSGVYLSPMWRGKMDREEQRLKFLAKSSSGGHKPKPGRRPTPQSSCKNTQICAKNHSPKNGTEQKQERILLCCKENS